MKMVFVSLDVSFSFVPSTFPLSLSFLPFFHFPLPSPLSLCFPSSVILPPSFPPTPLWCLPLFHSDFILLSSTLLLLLLLLSRFSRVQLCATP